MTDSPANGSAAGGTAARDQILGSIRRSLGRTASDEAVTGAADARLADPPRNLIPQRTLGLDADRTVALFVEKCRQAACTVDEVTGAAAIPGAVQAYLTRENLPARLIQAPAFGDAGTAVLDWSAAPTLQVSTGIPDGSEDTTLTPVFAGVAETGTLMLLSGPDSPTGLNFLPETHIAVIQRSQVVGPLEDAWARFRAAQAGEMPRTVNLITGPSRTADIEQQLQMGAHGPRRLHIIVVAD